MKKINEKFMYLTTEISRNTTRFSEIALLSQIILIIIDNVAYIFIQFIWLLLYVFIN